MKDGTIWTAGYGGQGFHGNGATDHRHLFEQLPLPSGVGAATALWAGGEYPQLWFNGDDGNTYACGYNARASSASATPPGTSPRRRGLRSRTASPRA